LYTFDAKNRNSCFHYKKEGVLFDLQGKSVDSLAHYAVVDPLRCPFEQGIFF
jgi:putative NADH-flavin reductase